MNKGGKTRCPDEKPASGGRAGFLYTNEDVNAILDYERRSQNRLAREIRLSSEWEKTLNSPGLEDDD